MLYSEYKNKGEFIAKNQIGSGDCIVAEGVGRSKLPRRDIKGKDRFLAELI